MGRGPRTSRLDFDGDVVQDVIQGSPDPEKDPDAEISYCPWRLICLSVEDVSSSNSFHGDCTSRVHGAIS